MEDYTVIVKETLTDSTYAVY